MSADTAAEWAALREGLPSHQDELMASHPGRPTPSEAIARGVTPSSGSDDDYGPFGSPIGGGP